MAYNSDGYIMLDFTEVDFRRTNQTIEGLFKRCVDVIGTNKFILVINANGRTPLPATCSFTNNQYVIDTVIYMFAVSSNDNLFIRRNDVPASDIIDDSSISVDKTWSSNKIDSELDTKADASALADYQPLLTAGDNISIVNNVISATGGGGLELKHISFVGDDTNPNVITFPDTPTLILCINSSSGPARLISNSFIYGTSMMSTGFVNNANFSTSVYSFSLSYNGNELTITASSAARAFNGVANTTTIYYI